MPLPSDLLCARIVVQRGFATEERVRECLELQAKNRAVGYDESLHAVLLKRGFLTSEDARKVERDLALAQFVRAERVFAKVLVEQGTIATDEAKDLLQKQKDDGYRTRIGDRLVELGKLTRAARDKIAAEQVKRLEAEDEAARQAEASAAPAAPPPTPSAVARPAPPAPPRPPGMASDDGEVTLPNSVGRATDAALASFKRDQRKFRGSGEQTPLNAAGHVKIEGFELVSRLGQGSVGVVWKARPTGGGEVVGLKVLSPSLTRNPDLLARFQKAYERAQAIEHPALVQLGPLARSGDLWYYTMELVEGESLGERVERGGPLPASKAREMAREVARALAHIHGQRVLHGGLRPSNVLIGRDGSIKVADLILARIAPRLSGEAGTDEARFYASPEELTNAAGADPRDDVYSFGLVLYYSLVGRHAFPDGQPSTRLMGAVDPRDSDQLADAQLSDIVVRCTAPSREGRYRDAHELLVAIDPTRASERLANAPRNPGATLELPPSSLGAVGESAAARAERERAEARGVANSVASSGRRGPGETDPVGDDIKNVVQRSGSPKPAGERRRRTLAPLPGSPGADLTGQVVSGRYKILAKLGEGGMGVVYRAEHTIMAKEIAFKVLHPSLVKSEESVARFQREVLAMAQFAHRNVVRIYDAGKTEDGRLYMAMELVDGDDLSAAMGDGGRVPAPRAVAILRQALRAIGEAHAKNIVHRDLKPQNILLTRGPANEEVVKVMDFGIAKILEQEGDGQPATGAGQFRTMERIVLGTPEYMSPEQASGSVVDHRSDLYSLGVIVYEMLLGRLPFDADSPVGFIGKHIVDPPLPFDEALPGHGLSPALEAFVMKALEKDPAERFPSADAMLRALEEAAPRETAEAAAVSLEARALAADRSASGSARKQTKVATPAASAPVGASSKGARKPPATPPPATPRPSSKSEEAAKPPKKSAAGLLVVLGVVAILGLGAVGVGLVLFLRVPFDKKLALAKEQSDAAVKVGDWAKARAPLDALLAKAGEADQPKVKSELERIGRLESDAKQKAEKKGRFDAAVAAAEGILKTKDLTQEKALADAIKRARDEEVDADAAAALEKRARRWRTVCHRELGEQLMAAKGELDAARDNLRAARDTADAAEQKEIDEKLLDVDALLDEERARRALETGDFAEAERFAAKASKRKDTPERAALIEIIRTKRDEFELEQRRTKVSKLLDEGAGLEKSERLDDARARYEAAEKEAARPPELADARTQAREKIAAVAKKLDALAAYKALPAFGAGDDEKKQAIAARESFLEKFPDGALAARVRADLENAKKDEAGRAKMEASAALDRALAEATTALEKRDEPAARAALDVARKAAATLDTPEARDSVDKLAARIDVETALAHALDKDFVAVPAGKAPAGFKDEALDAYWIGRAEVTNGQYYDFCDAVSSAAKADLDAVKAKNDAAATAAASKALDAADARWPAGWKVLDESDPHSGRVFASGTIDLPVAGISFDDARAFCAWKTARDGKASHLRFRLPREVEWERAARGEDGRRYPWGDTWVDGCAAAKGAPLSDADPKKWDQGKSPFGALHMSGNVAEWVDSPYTDKDGVVDADSRCAKGGSFRVFSPDQLVVTGPASREKLAPSERKETVGFRLLAEPAKD